MKGRSLSELGGQGQASDNYWSGLGNEAVKVLSAFLTTAKMDDGMDDFPFRLHGVRVLSLGDLENGTEDRERTRRQRKKTGVEGWWMRGGGGG